MNELTEQQKAALDKMEKSIGKEGLIGGDVPIIGNAPPKKPVALGKWVVCKAMHEKESQTEAGIYKPIDGEKIIYWYVESIGPDVERVKKDDIVIAPSLHQVGFTPTGQRWAVTTEDLIVCILEDE